ncbi:MAG TPA: AMP-binding protein [Mycobacteriales bacterium]|nr:AMP-binding protein [Mycobacteriales bacterium]
MRRRLYVDRDGDVTESEGSMATEPAVRCADVERNYAEFNARAAAAAAGLAEFGVGAGDRVAIVLRNSVEFLELSVAAGLAGAGPVPINWHWSGDDLRYVLSDSGSRVVFAHSDFVPTVMELAPVGVEVIEVPMTDALRQAAGAPPTPTGTAPRELESWLAEDRAPLQPGEGLPAGIIYTSGTTGYPKGIVREASDPEKTLSMVMKFVERFGLRPGGSTLVPAPMYHSAPNAVSALAVRLGMDVTVMPRFDPEEMLALIERYRIEQVQVVPTMMIRLLRLPEAVRNRYDLSSLKRLVHAAAPCPVDVKRQTIEWLGPIVHEYYGGTETGPVTWCDSEEWLAHPGTVGAAIDGAILRIVGADGEELPVGSDGTVYAKPPTYWPNFTYLGDDKKRQAMEREGYLTVGDVGHVDGDGYLYLSDRANDMVISGGVNIYPAEIEAVLTSLPGVHDSAVFGIPDEEYGEALAAHIELEPSAQLTEDDVRKHVRQHLAGYKVPKVVVFADELPREDTGKLFKRRLREPYWAGTGRNI